MAERCDPRTPDYKQCPLPIPDQRRLWIEPSRNSASGGCEAPGLVISCSAGRHDDSR